MVLCLPTVVRRLPITKITMKTVYTIMLARTLYGISFVRRGSPVSTIEKFDLENMGIAVGIFSIGATELEIQLGVILPPAGHPKV